MTNITESPDWSPEVYAVEKTDRVLGGPDGVVNRQAKNLADRTAYLKAQLAIVSRVASSYGTLASSLKTRLDRLERAVDSGGVIVDGGVTDPGPIEVSTGASSLVKNLQASTSLAVPVNEAGFFNVTLNEPSCVIRLDAFLDLSDAKTARKIDLLLTQGSGVNRVEWASRIRWAYGRQPQLSFERGYSDLVSLWTLDNGATWIGNFAGGWVLA